MDTQVIIVFALFALALSYMAWKFFKSIRMKNAGGCAKGCGCAADRLEKSK